MCTAEKIEMSEGFWPVIAVVVVVIIYVIAKVVHYMRQSEKQWERVDKTKLRKWEDDD